MALVAPLLILGCSNSYTVLQQKSHLAQFKVSTSPPGAQLSLNGEAQGSTPARLYFVADSVPGPVLGL